MESERGRHQYCEGAAETAPARVLAVLYQQLAGVWGRPGRRLARSCARRPTRRTASRAAPHEAIACARFRTARSTCNASIHRRGGGGSIGHSGLPRCVLWRPFSIVLCTRYNTLACCMCALSNGLRALPNPSAKWTSNCAGEPCRPQQRMRRPGRSCFSVQWAAKCAQQLLGPKPQTPNLNQQTANVCPCVSHLDSSAQPLAFRDAVRGRDQRRKHQQRHR